MRSGLEDIRRPQNLSVLMVEQVRPRRACDLGVRERMCVGEDAADISRCSLHFPQAVAGASSLTASTISAVLFQICRAIENGAVGVVIIEPPGLGKKGPLLPYRLSGPGDVGYSETKTYRPVLQQVPIIRMGAITQAGSTTQADSKIEDRLYHQLRELSKLDDDGNAGSPPVRANIGGEQNELALFRYPPLPKAFLLIEHVPRACGRYGHAHCVYPRRHVGRGPESQVC